MNTKTNTAFTLSAKRSNHHICFSFTPLTTRNRSGVKSIALANYVFQGLGLNVGIPIFWEFVGQDS